VCIGVDTNPAMSCDPKENSAATEGQGHLLWMPYVSCKPKGISVVTDGENSHQGDAISRAGRVDPKNPDMMSGKKVTGTIDTVLYTTTWNLRLLKPKSKK
jgi:hypothetical protein